MNILAIDTSGEDCGISINKGGTNKLVVFVNEKIKKGFAECLPSLLESALTKANLKISNIDRIGVSIGPGSFAGIRTGLSFVKGLSLVQRIPLVGLSTLQILTESINDKIEYESILALVDSKLDEYFVQVFSSDDKSKVNPQLKTTNQILDLISKKHAVVCAENSNILERPEIEKLTKIFIIKTNQKLKTICQLSFNATKPFNNPEPLYMRSPDAKPQSGFSVAKKI